MNSEIYFDDTTGEWRLQSLRYPSKFLTLQRLNDFPLGTREWILGTDFAVCGMKAELPDLG